MKRKSLLTMMLMFLLVGAAWAQRTVTGVVLDETGESLPGATVQLKGTTKGTVTDVEGKYSIQVPDNDAILVFSFVNYVPQEIEVGNRSTIDVNMEVTVGREVIVTGYKTYIQEQSNIAAVTLDADKINNRPNASAIQTLQGQIPGLAINTTSGQPGGNSVVNIRGVGSINGETEPLFIVDGTPVDGDNFRSINPNEIATMSVLKDAGATAIYGNRGANGVIVITTKTGDFNSGFSALYTGQYIVSQLQDPKYDLLSSPEQLRLENDLGRGRGAGLTDAEIDGAETFDWVDYFFRNAVAQDHNLQFRIGGKNNTAYISLGVRDQEGVLQDSRLQRYNLRSNITGRSDNQKFNYGVNMSVNYSENAEPNQIGGTGINRNYVLGAFQSVPYINADDYVDGRSLLSPLSFANTPLFLVDRLNTYTRTEDEVKLLGTLNLGYEIIDGLTVNSRSSADFTSENLIRTEGPTSFNAILFAQSGNNTPGFAQQQYDQVFSWNQLTSINYTKVLDEDHTINVGLYNELFRTNFYTLGFFNEGLDPRTFSPGDGSGFVDDNSANDFFVDGVNANILSQSLLSYFASADYDYQSTYGLTATIRRDASSRFIGDNKWGTFWSVAGRWNIHNMPFMSDLPFNTLKLRGSYGTNGNQNVDPLNNPDFGPGDFAALDLYRALFATNPGYGGALGISLAQIPNTALRWETVAQANVGLDFELWQSRLRGSLDGYIKTTSDLYQDAPVSAINGVTSLPGNNGKLQNRGVELMLAYDVIRNDDMRLTFNVVGAYNKQEILELPGGVDQIVLPNGNIHQVGGPLEQYYQIRYAGVNPENGNLLFLTADGEVTENPNPDTDRVATGKNIYPDAQGSFGLDFDWKGFFVQANFVYFIGMDRFDNDYSGFINPNNIGQFRHDRDILNAWTPDNTNTDIPSLTATNLNFTGTRFLTETDFLRLRFATIGYNLPKNVIDQTPLTEARVFFNGENLFTFTNWRGFDAEALSNTSRLYPTPRIFTVGVEVGF